MARPQAAGKVGTLKAQASLEMPRLGLTSPTQPPHQAPSLLTHPLWLPIALEGSQSSALLVPHLLSPNISPS